MKYWLSNTDSNDRQITKDKKSFARAKLFIICMRHRLLLLSLGLLMVLVIDLAYDGRRLVQMAVLVLPGLFLLMLNLSRPWMRRLRLIVVILWLAAFIFDAAMRVFLYSVYQAQPDSSLVLTAIANTTSREAVEYLQMYAQPLLIVLLVVLPLALLISALIRYSIRYSDPNSDPNSDQITTFRLSSMAIKGLVLIAILTCAMAYASKPWRRLHPFLYWPQWTIALTDLRTSWTTLDANRRADLQRAQAVPLTISTDDSVVVLVISESLNRDNMSTHGYPRPTTPQLAQLQQMPEANLINFRHAWSTKAATLASLDSFFYFDHASEQVSGASPLASPVPRLEAASTQHAPLHLIAMARAAGYHVTWISNHDDNGIEQKHARLANEVVLLNHAPGRSSNSPDDLAIKPFQDALAATHSRKLIVLHLMGVHPHYRLRFPETRDVFQNVNDTVRQQMRDAGRSSLIIKRRNEYDAAILHHDAILADTLRLTQKMTSNTQRAAWVFVSDHGQEVGHVKNHAGHSFTTQAGFRIPAFIWQKQSYAHDQRALAERTFRLDWMAWTLTGLMGVDWQYRDSHRDILSANYEFSAPDLGIQSVDFRQ